MKINQTTDYELVAKLNKNVQNRHVQLYPEYFKEYDEDGVKGFFKENISNPKFRFLLLEDEGQPLGYVWLEIRNYPESVFKKAYQSVYIHQISVVDSKSKKGLGTKLMDEIENIATDNEISKIELDYWSNNFVAENFYKKNGFDVYREHVYKNL